jgi:dimeric dUTPase (all-alpha-NTP-PPase superfamily)
VKITINDILTTQAILDQAIQTKHQTTYASTVNEIKLALIVELGELANEVRSFKFWSYKNPSNKEVILEEYVDGLHFIISFVIMYKIKLQLIIPDHLPQLTKQQLTIKFNDLFALITQLNLKVNINNKTVIKR